jgi:hypothetical protein
VTLDVSIGDRGKTPVNEMAIGSIFMSGVLSAVSVVLFEVMSASAGVPGRVNAPTDLVTVSGNRLAHACRPEAEASFEDGICLGYVLAMADAINNGSVDGKEACTPAAVLNVQIQFVTRKYFADHLDLLDRTALELVAAALPEAFPCSGANQRNNRSSSPEYSPSTTHQKSSV